MVTFVLHRFTWPPRTVRTLRDTNVTPPGPVPALSLHDYPVLNSLCGKKPCGRPATNKNARLRAANGRQPRPSQRERRIPPAAILNAPIPAQPPASPVGAAYPPKPPSPR